MDIGEAKAHVADLILMNPFMSNKEIAEAAGILPATLSKYYKEEEFLRYLTQRREMFVDPLVKTAVKNKLGAVTQLALQVVAEKLNDRTISDALLMKVLDLGMKGFVLDGDDAKINATINVDSSRLTQLANRLESLNRRGRPSNNSSNDAQDAVIIDSK